MASPHGAAARDGSSDMELHEIRYFLALSETLNFTRAAENCNVTQPALTRAIRSLEDKLGGEGSAWQFVVSLINLHNLYALAWEFATVAPVIALVAWWRARRERRHAFGATPEARATDAGNAPGRQAPGGDKPGS